MRLSDTFICKIIHTKSRRPFYLKSCWGSFFTPTLYLKECQVKCTVFGSQDGVPNLKREACDVDLRLAVIVFGLENGWYPKRTLFSFSLYKDYKGWY